MRREPATFYSDGLRLSGASDSAELEEIDRVLQADQRMHELVYRTHPGRWVALWDCDEDELGDRCRGCERVLAAGRSRRNLRWLASRVITIGDRGQRGLVHDLLVRDALWSHRREPIFDSRTVHGPQLSNSVAEARLDAELKRLSRWMGRQSRRVQYQAQLIGNFAGD